MARKKSVQTTHRILQATLLVLAVFNVLIWRAVLISGVTAPAAPVPTVTRVADLRPPVTTAPAVPVAQEAIGNPVRIQIPGIALDASIENVALAKDGTMGVPTQPLNTGWYALGPRPGETGSAVIDGHVNWLHGATAVFANLHKVKSGDMITVRDDKGADVVFVVREIRNYAAAAKAMDVFSSNDGKSHLNIITCDGVWDARAKQYTMRLVVFADKES